MPTHARHSMSRSKRLLAALSKHKTIVTLLSAFIVLGSFMIKDAVADRVKELSDSLKAAQSFNDKYEADKELKSQFLAIRIDISKLRPGIRDGGEEQEALDKIELKLNDASDWSYLCEDSLEELRSDELIIGRKDYYASKIKDAEKGRSEYLQRFDALSRRKKDLIDARQLHYKENQDAMLADINKLDHDGFKLALACGDLQYQGQKNLKSLSKRYELYHTICKYLAYCLFIFGWALSLASNISTSKPNKQNE
jgi:uncharacterized coiled-coil DUF342 family protein